MRENAMNRLPSLSWISLGASCALVIVLGAGCIIDDGYDSYDNGPGYYQGDYYNGAYDYGYYRDPPPRRPYFDDRGYYDRRDDHGHRDRHHDAPPARPGDFSAGGAAKEYAFSTGHRRCTIHVTDGTVGFRTIVVRRGGAKQSVTINATYQRGQSFDVPIDGNATGIRISDTGKGRYRVEVR